MKGWLIVEADGFKTDKQLSTWVKEGVEFALTLAAKIRHEDNRFCEMADWSLHS